MSLQKTGIAGLDQFLRGGLPPIVLLLVGSPASGNEIFARQVAYSIANQGKVTYLTITKSKENIKEEMMTYGWDTTPLEKSRNWKWVNPLKEEIVDIARKETQQDRTIVIDSLSELLLTQKTEEATALLTSISEANRNTRQMHLVLLTEGMQTPELEMAMQHFADGIISFNVTMGTEYSSRHLHIKKLKGAVIPTRNLPYSIGEKGLTIETAIRIT